MFTGSVFVSSALAGSTTLTNNGIRFPDGTTQTTSASGGFGQWSASGFDIYYNAGKVGIGTTNPLGRVDIAGGALAMEGNPGTAGQVLSSNGAGTAPAWKDVSFSGGFDAVVSASGGDYATVGAALAAGKTNIFVKEGSYQEGQWTVTSDGITITGQRRGAVTVNFSDPKKAIQIKSNNACFENLVLRGANDTDYLIYCDSGKKNIVVVNCDFESIDLEFVYGNNSSIRLYGCRLDGTGGATNGLMGGFYKNSVVEGCELITDPDSNLLQHIWHSISGTISGCTIEGNSLSASTVGVVIGCRFSVKRLVLDGIWQGNIFTNNADPESDAFLTLGHGTKFIGNIVSLSYYDKKTFLVSGNGCIIIGNTFGDGKDMEISGKYTQFINNRCQGSVQQTTLTLSSACTGSQINQNILISEGYMPRIVDNGLENNTLNNIFVQQ